MGEECHLKTHQEDHDKVIRLEEKLHGSEDAVKLARQEIDRRLAEMNELRTQIYNERTAYLGRTEFELKHEVLATKVEVVQKTINKMIGGLLVFQILADFIIYWFRR